MLARLKRADHVQGIGVDQFHPWCMHPARYNLYPPGDGPAWSLFIHATAADLKGSARHCLQKVIQANLQHSFELVLIGIWTPRPSRAGLSEWSIFFVPSGVYLFVAIATRFVRRPNRPSHWLWLAVVCRKGACIKSLNQPQWLILW
jgi:hypothetical protein